MALTGCGGGDVPDLANPSLRTSEAPVSSPLRSQLAAAPSIALDDDALFDWAEAHYPEFFPSHRITQVWSPYVYRFYPETQAYLAVTDGTVVQVLGPQFGPDILTVGPKSGYACLVLPQACTPVASAGPTQTVDIGSLVQLSGLASMDPNGLPLTYIWTFTSKPAMSNAVLDGANGASSTFVPDVAGTYSVALLVSNGTYSASKATTVTATSGIQPVPVGTGLLAGYMYDGFFYRVDEDSGRMTALPYSCPSMTGADIGPDGIVYVNSQQSVSQADPINGKCLALFDVPEAMWALAVSSSGEIVTVSQNKTFGRYQVYRFTMTGELLSKAPLSLDLPETDAFRLDFAPNGDLLVAGYQLNPGTGMLTAGAYPVPPSFQNSLEVAVDQNGMAHTISMDYVSVYSITSGQLVKKTLLERTFNGQGAAVYR